MENGIGKKYGAYTVEKLRDGLYALDDEQEDSFYLVEGSRQAAVIDTGMGSAPILPVIRQLTKLPCILLVTHVHGDHMKLAGEFQERYTGSRELPLLPVFAAHMEMPPDVTALAWHTLEPGDTVDLGGGVVLEAVAMYGHTLGSLGFYCAAKKALFTGDAIGSGSGVFMQLKGCLSLKEYKESLEGFIQWAKQKGIPEDQEFLSGHRSQRYGFPGMHRDNPVNLKLAQDMAVLCEKLLDGSVRGRENPLFLKMGDEVPWEASWGKADMVYLPSAIKD